MRLARTFVQVAIVTGTLACGLQAHDETIQSQDQHPRHPLAFTSANESKFRVAQHLPGVWRSGGGDDRNLFVRDSNRPREPRKRPRCMALLAGDDHFIGNTPTWENDRIEAAGATPQPSTSGRLEISMSVVVVDAAINISKTDTDSKQINPLIQA
ncbi:hypothetical protein Poly24_24960 [Rosistilla carotiformis]|uniref:Uncharacterized protein n=1 Tax=Rosistilla carotiformis TaxID=2528017 RepID=A0A518JTB3_9BACT|nr:hypothetical protein [Rosistilla carotiformis]QDV68783.1 hypothetical protein Poly24_24960 [Rosistilla carotiformis]